jgi:hypothetical protein
MATFPTSKATGFFLRSENPVADALEIEEEFTFRVLDEGSGHLASGTVSQLVGRRLIAQVSEYVKPDACVRIDCNDAFLLGEILGCWREGPATFAAVQLLQALTGLEQLARFREECLDLAQPLKPKVRQWA